MSDFVIIPDASCDMTKKLRERFGIEHAIRGVLYTPSGVEMPADLDWETMSPEEYYNSMRGKNALYKSATPPVGEITKTFETVLQSGKDILSISLSTGISGTFNSVENVAKSLLEKYPERKIICIDSLRYASGIALLVSLACKKKSSGATLEETADYINTVKHSIHQMGALDDLFFCVKTGRISNFKAFFGTLIGINFFADFSTKGLPAILGKVKGKRTVISTILNYMEKTIVNPENQIIFVSHSNREENALVLAEEIKKRFNPKDVIINPLGMSCGTSIGPGLCAAFYLGDPVSEGETKERAIMENILKP